MKKLASKIGMIVGGAVASEAVDRSGEVISIEGADISMWEEGKMLFNFDHFNDKSQNPSGNDIVGKVIYAKKIFSQSDCDNDAQLRIWKNIKTPFIWAIGRLFNGSGHPGAQALAAIIRDNYAHGERSNINFSVEGSTLERKNNILEKTFIRKIALTHKEANATCTLELIYDPDAEEDKQFGHEDSEDLLKEVAKQLSKSLETSDDEYETLSKKERSIAKNAVKALVAKKILKNQDRLIMFKKLLPLYEVNGKLYPIPKILDESTFNFINQVKSSPITINFSPVKLIDFIRTGNFKNQFEDSHAFERLDKEERLNFEAKTFGLPLNTSYKNRPIYGSLHLKFNDPELEHEGGAPMYGTAFLTLKPEVKKRATFTHNDSFVVTSKDVLTFKYLDKVAIKYIKDPDKSDFIEAQIYGGIDFSKDVDSLNVPNDSKINNMAIIFGEKYSVSVYAYNDNGQKIQLYIPLSKTLEAGIPTAAPSMLAGGAALQIEDLTYKKKKIKKLLNKAFSKSGLEKNKENFIKFIKASLPEVDDEYLDFFDDAIDDLNISKKTFRKMEYLSIEITNALYKMESVENNEDKHLINFNGKNIIPGKAIVNGYLHYLIDETPEDFIACPYDKSLNELNLLKLSKIKSGQDYQLHSPPIIKANDEYILDSGTDGIVSFNHTPEQHALIDELPINSQTKWLNHPKLGKIFSKESSSLNSKDFSELHREIVYHNLANSFFDLGELVPKMAAFINPDTAKLNTVQMNIKKAYISNINKDIFNDSLIQHISNGQMIKILFMDYVLGNCDRSFENLLHSKNGKIFLVDHENVFETPNTDSWLNNNIKKNTLKCLPIDPEVQKWASQLNRNDLYKQLIYNNVPYNKIQEVMNRFDLAKYNVIEGINIF